MKIVRWVGCALDILRSFPEEVRSEVGFSLEAAQRGGKALNAVPLVGFSGAGVVEIISNFDGDTYRAVYTVRYSETVYVIHAFKKKSTRGIATPRRELNLIRKRLSLVEAQEAQKKKKESAAEPQNVKSKR